VLTRELWLACELRVFGFNENARSLTYPFNRLFPRIRNLLLLHPTCLINRGGAKTTEVFGLGIDGHWLSVRSLNRHRFHPVLLRQRLLVSRFCVRLLLRDSEFLLFYLLIRGKFFSGE